MFGHRLRRWPNIDPTLSSCLMFAGYVLVYYVCSAAAVSFRYNLKSTIKHVHVVLSVINGLVNSLGAAKHDLLF